MESGQTDAFPVSGTYEPDRDIVVRQLQSASMPLASRRLGRSDEAWLVQVLSRLNVMQTHLALNPSRRFIQVDLLQTNVKLAKAEIDALFLAVEELPGDAPRETREVVVTCETKGLRDDTLEEQLIAQVRAASAMRGLGEQVELIAPCAAKAVGPSRVYVVQFAPVDRGAAGEVASLTPESEAIYELVPSVPGVGK